MYDRLYPCMTVWLRGLKETQRNFMMMLAESVLLHGCLMSRC
jgi:hypothetical protein